MSKHHILHTINSMLGIKQCNRGRWIKARTIDIVHFISNLVNMGARKINQCYVAEKSNVLENNTDAAAHIDILDANVIPPITFAKQSNAYMY